MSISPFRPDPLEPPFTAFIEVPQSFWDELAAYRSPSMKPLTLEARDSINRKSYDKAKKEFDRELTVTRIETRGHAFSLKKVMDRAKQWKRYYVDCEVYEREEALTTLRRVPCGARKKDGSQCRAMAEPGRTRCRFHGGRSTGPRTVEGMRKALSCLPQYKDNPERLEAKLAEYADRLNA